MLIEIPEACYNVYSSLEIGNQRLGLSNLPNLAEWLFVKNLNVCIGGKQVATKQMYRCTNNQTTRRSRGSKCEVEMFTISRPQEPQEFSDTYCLQLNAT